MQSTFIKSVLIFFLTLWITACGSERDTPFNPNTNNSSSAASIGASVEIKEFARYDEKNPQQPVFLETDGQLYPSRQTFIIETEKDFEAYWDLYKNDTVIPTDLDFAEIQVVILDLGNIGNCPQKTTYRNAKAYEYSNNTVLVNFNFREANEESSSSSSSSSSSPECTDPVELAKKRPFYFYSVATRKKILIKEEVIYE